MSCNNCLNIPCCCSNYTTTTTTIACDDPQCEVKFTTDCIVYTGELAGCLNIETTPLTVTELLESIISTLDQCTTTTTESLPG